MGLFEGFTAEDLTDLAAEDLTDVVPADLEGNGVLEPLVQPEQREQPKQSQGESDAKGIVIPEIANPDPDTVPGKRSIKRHAFKPKNVVLGDRPESVIHKPLRRSDRLIIKRQKLDSTETKFLPLPQGTATRSQSAAMPEKSTDSQKNTEQNPDKSLKEHIRKETKKWIYDLSGVHRDGTCVTIQIAIQPTDR